MAKSGTLRVKVCEMCGVDLRSGRYRVCSIQCRSLLPKPRTAPGAGVQCDYCGAWYSRRAKLTRHCDLVHHDDLPVGCPACDRRFLDERGKQTHMGYAHPDLIRARRNDPDIQREWNLRANYGIGVADYARMLAEQGGTCACCDATEAGQPRGRLLVDHCHATGGIRGLLCNGCNFAVGQAGDSPERLRRLADYLERP